VDLLPPPEEPVTAWTGQAHLLAADIREPGTGSAITCASAWRAGVTPEATHGLVAAAVALTGNDVLTSLWADVPPCDDDTTLLRYAAELEGDAAELLKRARRMARDCHTALAAACEEAARAHARLTAAADPQARAAAQAALDAARAVIADCEAALEIIDDCGHRLAHAANCLRRVPDDLASAYEKPYEFVHDGGKLPYEGVFLTGGVTWEAA
jgi:hypothetical protein